MTDTPDLPSPATDLVPMSPVRTMTDVMIGQLVQSAGGVLIAYGALTPAHATALVGFGTLVGCAAWRVISARITHARLVTAAHAAPNSVAMVVRS